MRVPQVSERIKEAPAQALRGVFAGIGQLLLITDKLRNKTPASQQVPRARAPEPAGPRAEPTSPPGASVPADPPVSAAPPAAAAAPPTTAAPSAPAARPTPAARPAAAASAPAAPAAPAAERVAEARDPDKTGNVRLLTSAEAAAGDTAPTVRAAASVAKAAPVAELRAPLPNYDELSIASLRARLRNLDVPKLRQLVEYESAHAARADVITMFERRIAKLQAETTPEERGEAEAEAEIEAQENVEAEVQDDVGPEAEGEE